MKKFLISFIMVMFCVSGILGMFTGCGDQDQKPEENKYDLSAVTVTDATYDYDGTAKSVTISGTIPNGVETKITYFTDELMTQEYYSSPIDSGTYYAKVEFVEKDNGKVLLTKTAKLQINKISMPEHLYSFVAVNKSNNEKVTPYTDKDGSLYFEFDGNNYFPKVEWNLLGIPQTNARIEYYKDAELKDRVLVNIDSRVNLQIPGDTYYLRVIIEDSNHNERIDAVQKFYMTKKIIKIQNADDLKKLNTDIYENTSLGDFENAPNSNTLRKYYKYELEQDIDLGNNPWQTITPSYEPSLSSQPFFCSEFDGQGYSIKNFKITNDSLKYTLTLSDMSTVEVDGLYRQTPVETFMESYAGFFGFVVSADIHDVNFENVNFELDFNKIRDDGSDLGLYYFNNGATNTNDKGQISQILHAGVLCGRTVRKMPNSTLPADTLCSNIYNITATNVSGKIVCAQISFGGIIGTDNSANIEEEYLRQNLHVTGLDITTQFTGVGTGNSNVHFGGIVGDVLEESNLVYRNCSSSGKVAVLGYADASLVGQQIKGLKGSESKNKTYVKYGNAPSSIPEAGSRSLDLNGLGITNHATNNYGAFCVGGILGRSYRVGMGAAQFSEGLMFDSCSSDLNIIIYNYFNVKKKKGIEFLIKGIQFYIAHGTEADPNLPSEVPNSRETSGLCGFDDSTVNRRLIEINCQDSCTYDIHKNNNEVYSPAI